MSMSDLQISLIIIGAIVVVGVVLFNWMQQRRYRRGAEQAFGRKHDDVLLDVQNIAAEDDRIEPRLGDEALSEFRERSATGTPEPANKVWPDTESKAEPVAFTASVDEGAADGANAVDYVAEIKADTSIPASSLTEVLQRKYDFGKPVRWLGTRTESGGSWCEITMENLGQGGRGEYASLKACLQLADRSGPVSEVSLSGFRDMVQNFAARVNAAADCPDIREAHAQAVLLDQFCAEVDVMIGVNIISKDGGAFTGTKIRALAEASGFKLQTEGMFSYPGEGVGGAAFTQFSLCNYESLPFLPDSIRTLTTHGVTFLLDVPRVANGEKIFDQMAHLAGIFSTTLGGIMVDDNRVPLSDSGLSKIKQQLGGIQDMMKARNIPAGGEIALRLFM